MKKLAILVGSLVATAPVVASAHPGHGTTDPSSAAHYLVEPVHAVVIVSALVAVAIAIGAWGWQKSRASAK